MVDPMGALIAELKAANIASQRIRGGEPAGKTATYEGDALGPGAYKRFVVLVMLGWLRLPRAPVAFHRIGVRAYGSTYQDAVALFGEISDQIHNAGPRIGASNVIVYQTLDTVGGNSSKDPVTGQPYADGVIELIAGTEVLAGS